MGRINREDNKMIITRNKTIISTFSDEEYASIVYQILYDAKLNDELIQEIRLLPEEIKIRTTMIK